MEKAKTLEYLDLMDNQIGPLGIYYCEKLDILIDCNGLFLIFLDNLGCEFLGRVLHPRMEITLQKLKLDHNEFGTEGLKQLAAGLCMNSVLEKLSLNYCAITAEGSKYI